MRNLSIDQQLQSQATATFIKNRLTLKSILKAIIFCGRQNIALCGHRELSNLHKQNESGNNPGNFQALLQLQIECGDSILKEHVTNGPKNAKYSSRTVQNELIAAVGQYMQQKIVTEVKEAKYISVCADEAIDASNKEQLPLVLCFVDAEGQAREEFIEFVLCDTGTSGRAIAEKILQKLSLDAQYLRQVKLMMVQVIWLESIKEQLL